MPPPPGLEYPPLWGLSFVRLVDHLVTALLERGPLTPAATFEDGVQVQRVMDALRGPARDGWVPIEAPAR